LWFLREEIPVLLNGGGKLRLGFLKAKERALIVLSSLELGAFGSLEIGVFDWSSALPYYLRGWSQR
jgi:hypothetical protein